MRGPGADRAPLMSASTGRGVVPPRPEERNGRGRVSDSPAPLLPTIAEEQSMKRPIAAPVAEIWPRGIPVDRQRQNGAPVLPLALAADGSVRMGPSASNAVGEAGARGLLPS